LGGGFELIESKERLANVDEKTSIKIMTMVLKKGNAKILGSYFFFQRGRIITSPWFNKLYLMWDAFTRNRTDGALVRVEMTVAPGQSTEDAYMVLQGFLKHLWPLLPKYIPL
jgi:EpsI family protein